VQFYCPHALADGNQHIWIREDAGVLLKSVIYTVSVPPWARKSNKNSVNRNFKNTQRKTDQNQDFRPQRYVTKHKCKQNNAQLFIENLVTLI